MSTHRKSVSISPHADSASTLSKGQKTFNDLVAKIGKQRARLAGWETAIGQYEKKYSSEFAPALKELTRLEIEMIHALDRAGFEKGLSKGERLLIDELIVELAGPLLMDREDEELKVVYDRHSDIGFDEEQAAAAKGMKSVLQDVFGVDLEDEQGEAHSLDDIVAAAEAEIEEKSRKEADDRQSQADARTRRRPSARELALEARRQTEAHEVSQSLREVYRKLASALHPDREPDPAERDRKTRLMQRVNDAYAKQILLQLLELQLELEHIDQSAINNISEDRLRRYNQILKDQLAELALEIMHVEMDFRMRFGVPPMEPVAPKKICRSLTLDIADIQYRIGELKDNLRAVHVGSDIKQLKHFIARKRRSRRALQFGDFPS